MAPAECSSSIASAMATQAQDALVSGERRRLYRLLRLKRVPHPDSNPEVSSLLGLALAFPKVPAQELARLYETGPVHTRF